MQNFPRAGALLALRPRSSLRKPRHVTLCRGAACCAPVRQGIQCWLCRPAGAACPARAPQACALAVVLQQVWQFAEKLSRSQTQQEGAGPGGLAPSGFQARACSLLHGLDRPGGHDRRVANLAVQHQAHYAQPNWVRAGQVLQTTQADEARPVGCNHMHRPAQHQSG